MNDVILVQRTVPGSKERDNIRKLAELKELAFAAGYNVLDSIVQQHHPDRRYHVGKGKAEEIAGHVAELYPSKVIFLNPLTITQIYNLSELCQCEVIDKFQLILEIFATRATTSRSKLQVELAKLEYELPRARKLVSLLKQEERPGFMGMGGYEDSYEQDLKKRISRIRKELKNTIRSSATRRESRHEQGFSLISLAGYTNAGKSTLFNTLVSENVESMDMLFTTLSPTTRSININGRRAMLTDTVGFIEDLPHFLVDAFRSTLEDVFLSDIILLVVDASDPIDVMRKKLAVSHDIFWKQLENAVIITVFNKVDLVSPADLEAKINALRYLCPNPVIVSAKESIALDKLKETIYSNLPEWKRFTISLPNSDKGMSVLSWLMEQGIVHSTDYGDTITLDVEASDSVVEKAKKFVQNLLED
ncbi:GTPase HflX [Methanohalophilus sp.]|uniref:GTPase HflX n=1 Tax=Methanohalophilus sp. TaxID=1966352 RepID=UPI002611FCD4|nr:GTPase HflX [Methanohalophilus sp.]MDK2892814.1 GTPase [Methanohalophilus sp.]